jgi:hypothetical protein
MMKKLNIPSTLRSGLPATAVLLLSGLMGSPLLAQSRSDANAKASVTVNGQGSSAPQALKDRSDSEARPNAVSAYVQTQEGEERTTMVIDGDLMVRISERPKRGITIIAVESVRGNEKINRFEARSAELLKTRDPRGYELYEKYVLNPPAVSGNTAIAASGTTDSGNERQLRAELDALKRQYIVLSQQAAALQRMTQQSRQQSGYQQGAQQSSQQAFQFGGAGAFAGASARARASANAQSSSSSSAQAGQSASPGGRGR